MYCWRKTILQQYFVTLLAVYRNTCKIKLAGHKTCCETLILLPLLGVCLMKMSVLGKPAHSVGPCCLSIKSICKLLVKRCFVSAWHSALMAARTAVRTAGSPENRWHKRKKSLGHTSSHSVGSDIGDVVASYFKRVMFHYIFVHVYMCILCVHIYSSATILETYNSCSFMQLS